MNLSPREQQVYDLMVKGMSLRKTAEIIGLSVRSIKYHRSSIIKKFGAYSSREVVAIHYMNLGIVNEYGIPGIESLSKAERRVYDYVIKGISRKEIASKIFRTDGTVMFHFGNISTKLGVNSMLEMVVYHYLGKGEYVEAREAA